MVCLCYLLHIFLAHGIDNTHILCNKISTVCFCDYFQIGKYVQCFSQSVLTGVCFLYEQRICRKFTADGDVTIQNFEKQFLG